MSHEVHIYTDGAAKGNPGPAGYGVVMEMVGTPYKKEFYEGFRLSTNNRMELLAVIEAIKALKAKHLPLHIFTDSKYIVDSVEKKWLKFSSLSNYLLAAYLPTPMQFPLYKLTLPLCRAICPQVAPQPC